VRDAQINELRSVRNLAGLVVEQNAPFCAKESKLRQG
jgi:hypothetical protein